MSTVTIYCNWVESIQPLAQNQAQIEVEMSQEKAERTVMKILGEMSPQDAQHIVAQIMKEYGE